MLAATSKYASRSAVSVPSNPAATWLASQNGLFSERPQRHSV
jgi:hypothetical protein